MARILTPWRCAAWKGMYQNKVAAGPRMSLCPLTSRRIEAFLYRFTRVSSSQYNHCSGVRKNQRTLTCGNFRKLCPFVTHLKWEGQRTLINGCLQEMIDDLHSNKPTAMNQRNERDCFFDIPRWEVGAGSAAGHLQQERLKWATQSYQRKIGTLICT